MPLPERPNAEAIKAYRAAHECGMQEAKAELNHRWRVASLRQIRVAAGELYTVEACRDVIVDMLDLFAMLESDQ